MNANEIAKEVEAMATAPVNYNPGTPPPKDWDEKRKAEWNAEQIDNARVGEQAPGEGG